MEERPRPFEREGSRGGEESKSPPANPKNLLRAFRGTPAPLYAFFGYFLGTQESNVKKEKPLLLKQIIRLISGTSHRTCIKLDLHLRR